MTQRILYKNEDGQTTYLTPNLSCGLTLSEIALKDVPAGKPFVIVDEAALKDVEVFSAAIDLDTMPSDGVGADFGVGSLNAVVGMTKKREFITGRVVEIDGVQRIDRSKAPVVHKPVKEVSLGPGRIISIKLDAARELAHEKRRAIRAARFESFDKIIAKQIPGHVEQAEASRQNIRAVDALVQKNVDKANTPDKLKAILSEYENES